ncbi:5'-methylthioadenosine/adenosylhomocysteine nucleosidase [Buchnera aphidicola]|uniref:5'-methylthioadenosine/S-adenosylhomocysteine nucleosidase n=1 Tax=Buchnera aphidicola (Artemisaphis artemisicola) TaxID=1241836 RepID=A0A4D6XJA2_9GAMM|nr:5'-methylthioadenosine/adenosylhomocysteine nucleosidase [Buchnera aphidicola]QCI15899.1 5'-methylthioadenosine/adenosylhomocysteine nucleosidase [Buchnera aphidicola (Artemisaphis artemisicola)]
MKIGIIGAINQEIKIIQKKIQIHTKKEIANYIIYIGKFNKNDIFLIKSGIGKVCASIATVLLINLYKPNIIINTGSAGSLNSSLAIGDVIVPKKVCYYDVDLTNFGYTIGQIPQYPEKFIINKKIYNFLESIFEKYQLKFKKKLIITGDSFIRKDERILKLKNKFPSAIAVEMESAAIAQVCYEFNIPLIIVKSISDLSDNNATLNFKENISIASYQSSKFVKIILKNIINI